MLKLLHPITSINGFKIGDKVRLKDGDGRPHIIKSFSIDGMKEFFFEVQFEDGTETMLDNVAPLTSDASLPSNLDEAAEISDLEAKNLADDYTTFLAVGLTKNELRPIGPRWMKKLASDRFKAGAEWMAGQGSSREVEVKEDAGGYPYIPSIELYDYDKDEPLFKPGDKVIVQIRKKQ